MAGQRDSPILAVGLIGLLAAWVRQISSEFAVTNKRVIIKTGFLSRRDHRTQHVQGGIRSRWTRACSPGC